MVDLVETLTIMATLMMEVMIRKHLKIKRKVLQKPQTVPVTLKKVANKEKEQSSRFLQPLANKAEHKIMMTVRKRRLKHPAKKSDLQHRISPLKNKLKFE